MSLGLEIGGMEKLLVEFARLADRGQYELHFVSLTDRGILADEVEAHGWTVHGLEKRPGIRFGITWKLVKLFRQLRVDVVHSHSAPACIYGVSAARLARIPVSVNTRHGPRPELGSRQDRLYAYTARFADRIVGVSKDVASIIVRGGVPRNRVTTIWNGIDIEKYAFSGPAPGGPAVVVGRLSPEKNVETLLRSLPEVIKWVPAFRLQIIGDGPSRANLELLARHLNIGKHVDFIGQSSDVPGRLREASMLVLPSWTEGISLALLEAMAIGLPVIASRVGGNPEVIARDEMGLLVSPRDAAGMAEAIVRVASDGALANGLGQEARRRVERAFNIRNMIRAYEQLYLDCLHHKKITRRWSARVRSRSRKLDEFG